MADSLLVPLDTSPPDLVSPRAGFTWAGEDSKRRSFLVQADHLLILSHTWTKDKIERIGYDRIDYTVMQVKFPIARAIVWGIVLFLVLLLFVSLAIAGANKESLWYLLMLLFPLLLVAIYIIRAVTMRNINLTLMRGGTPKSIKTYASKKKALKAYEKLTIAIRAEQARLTATN